jgi:hypothetical protein
MKSYWRQEHAPVQSLPILLAGLASFALILPANASDITVGSPVNGSRISRSALIRAHNVGCNGQFPTAFGLSIDDADGIVKGESPYDIDFTTEAIPPGTHTIYFKSWTQSGACPVVASTFMVDATDDATAPSIPSNAVSSGDLDGSSKWTEDHDGGTPGKSKGTTQYPSKTPSYDDAREFHMTYSDEAGERWSNTFTKDSVSTHFVLDTYVYLPNPSQVKNVELDINQVTSNGETIILSTQCSGENGSWEYGDTVGKHDHWKSTNIKCNPKNWTANVWHHIQIGEHRDTDGFVTHDWVTFDGQYNAFENATLESAHFLDWGSGDLNTQFQIEGANAGSGTVTAYIHKFTIYRWH